MRRFTSPARRHILIFAIAIVLTTSALVMLSCCDYYFSAHFNESTVKVVPDILEIIARARLNHLQSRFKQEDTLKEMGLKIGNPAWDEYVNELQEVYQRFFVPDRAELEERKRLNTSKDITNNETSDVQRVQERLADSFKDPSKRTGHLEYQSLKESIPYTIHATSKKPIFPPQFSSWDRLNSEDGWEVKYWDDDRIWQWMTKVFSKEKETSDEGSGQTGGAEILKVYEQLPSGVLRGKHDDLKFETSNGLHITLSADLFRYLVLLMEGGLYTDTDTACIRPIRQWPGLRESHWDLMWKTDPLLASLPHLYDLLTIAASSDIQGHSLNGTHNTLRHRKVDAVQSWIKDNERNSWEPPKLIVAVEFDYWGPHAVKTWTEIGYSRGFQIVQWTILAQPGHPVFLDVLGRIIRDVGKHRAVRDDYVKGPFKEEISKDTLLDVLDFTGPGVFSDAVFRYLLARWGTHPHDISGASGPIRVGDVLIYPLKSFSAAGDIDDYQGEHKLVWHGFFGSWKGW